MPDILKAAIIKWSDFVKNKIVDENKFLYKSYYDKAATETSLYCKEICQFFPQNLKACQPSLFTIACHSINQIRLTLLQISTCEWYGCFWNSSNKKRVLWKATNQWKLYRLFMYFKSVLSETFSFATVTKKMYIM